MNLFCLIFILTTVLLIIPLQSSHGQTLYTINIPTGASNPESPYFWQEESIGDTSGKIEIFEFDAIEWKNGDTQAHSITSGTPQGGPDNKFDSGLFGPGESFILQFNNLGIIDYYCTIHPWMVGKVTVNPIYLGTNQVLKNIGSEFIEGGEGYDVQYTLEGKLESEVEINPEENTMTFFYDSQGISEDVLIIELPTELIDPPRQVWIDGERETEAIRDVRGNITTFYLPLYENSKEITFVSSKVIPEFNSIVTIILMICVAITVILTRKNLAFKLISPKKILT